jgi:hypothetical protein
MPARAYAQLDVLLILWSSMKREGIRTFLVLYCDMRVLSNTALCSTWRYILVAAAEENKEGQSDGVLGELYEWPPEGTLVYTR